MKVRRPKVNQRRLTALKERVANLTECQIALIVATGGGRYVGLLEKIPGKIETVVLFRSPQTGTTLGLCVSRLNTEAVREQIAESDEVFAKAAQK